GPQAIALPVLAVHAVVSQQRIGEGDDLAAVGRIGKHFLIAGHAGVEHHFAARLAERPEGFASEDAAILEGQNAGRATFHRLPPDETGAGRAALSTAVVPSWAEPASRCVIRPFMMVASTRPLSRHPEYGVLRPLDAKREGSTVHSRSGSNTTKSATSPG